MRPIAVKHAPESLLLGSFDARGSQEKRPATSAASPTSWRLGAEPADWEFLMDTSPVPLSQARSPMAQRQAAPRPVSASPTTGKAQLWHGSEGHRRAHIQSMATMPKELLAERLFHDKQTIVSLREQVVCALHL